MRANASSLVTLTRFALATPCQYDWPAETDRRSVPSALSWASTAACAPEPRAIIVITAPTPITIPSVVRNDRSLDARIAEKATQRISR